MLYELIELHLYNRFNLTGIKTITITPKNKMQLILGTNGSGKSSLLSEITPLPITKNFFEKSGYKRLIILHNNSRYELISKHENGVKNTFIKDGIILHEDGTSSVQKALVKTHFGITQEIHDLFIGKTKFTGMSPAERRKWITSLSNVDYDYIIKLHNNAKELFRNKKVILDTSVSERMKLEANRLSEDERSNLSNTIKEFKESLDFKINEKRIIEHENNKLGNDSLPINEKLENLALQTIEIINKDNIFNLLSYTPKLEILNHKHSVLSHDYQNYKQARDTLEKEIFNLEKELDGYNGNIEINSEDQLIFNQVQTEVNNLLSSLSIKISLDDLVRYNDFLLGSLSELEDLVFVRMLDNSERFYNKEVYKQKQELEITLKNDITKHSVIMTQVTTAIEKLEDLAKHKITCPNCSHSWANGYDEDYHKRLIAKQETLTNEYNNLKLDLAAVDDYLKTYQEHMSLVQNIATILRPIKQSLVGSLDHITVDVILYDLSLLKRIINGFKTDIPKIHNLIVLKARLQELTAKLEKEKLMKDIALKAKYQTFLIQNKELETIIENGDKVLKELNETNEAIKFTETLNNHRTKLEELTKQTTDSVEFITNNNKIKIINEVIYLLSNELSRLEKKLNEAEFIERNIELINVKIEKLDKEMRAAKLVVRGLSPNEGLIAKSVIGLINNVLLNINNIIKKVWTYDLDLLPITPEDNDLDYKFKFAINGGEPFDDINLGSSAMGEIINLGFKITTMKYLNMLDYPIYLDEFGHSMDDLHRRQAFFMIDKSLGTAAFSQVFIVSHFSESYGSLSNTDITVLSEDNLMLPFNEYNGITKIVY